MAVETSNRRSRLTRAENDLIQVQSLFMGASAIAGVFLNLYLFKVGGIQALCIFSIAFFIFLTVPFVLSGYLLRKYPTHQLLCFGLILTCMFYVLLIELGSHATHLTFLLGAIAGFSQGFYWSNLNVSEYVITHESTRNIYYGKLFLLTNVASVLAPPIAGIVFFIATATGGPHNNIGYKVLFGILVIALFLTFWRARETPALHGSTYSLRHILNGSRSRHWNLVLAQALLRGIWTGPLQTFSTILLFLVVDRELTLSVLTGLTALLAGGASMAVGRVLQHHPRAHWLGAMVVPVGLIGFALQRNWLGIACFVLLVSCFDNFSQTSILKVRYDTIDLHKTSWGDKYHLLVECEMALNLGRIGGYAIVLGLLKITSEVNAVSDALLIIAVLPFVSGLLQWGLGKVHEASGREETDGLISESMVTIE